MVFCGFAQAGLVSDPHSFAQTKFYTIWCEIECNQASGRDNLPADLNELHIFPGLQGGEPKNQKIYLADALTVTVSE